MFRLAHVTQTIDNGAPTTTYSAGWFTVVVTSVGALGSFGNFLVNLGVHRQWSWLILDLVHKP